MVHQKLITVVNSVHFTCMFNELHFTVVLGLQWINGYSCIVDRNCFCRELLPRLPTDGIFAVDGCARKGPVQCRGESVSWQWKDDRGHWRPYSLVDSRIIEVMHCCVSDLLYASCCHEQFLLNTFKQQCVIKSNLISKNDLCSVEV